MKKIKLFLAVLLLMPALAGCLSGPDAATRPGPAAGGEAREISGALDYARWMLDCLDRLEADMEEIVSVAETAAALHVNEGCFIGAAGEPGAVSELVGRSGGMMRLVNMRNRRLLALLEGPGIVLYFPRWSRLERDARQIAAYREQGHHLIVFGAGGVIDALRENGVAFDAALENHAAPGGGLYRDESGRPVVPTDKTANVALLWAWQGEFLAACTRLGRMPLVYQGFVATGGLQYAQRHLYSDGRDLGPPDFYPEKPEPVAPGLAGREFIAQLRRKTGLLVDHEIPSARALGLEAARRLAGKEPGRLRAFLFGHSVPFRGRVDHDPGYFTQVNRDGVRFRPGMELTSGDILLRVGYCEGQGRARRANPENPWFEAARRNGVLLAWSSTFIRPAELDGVAPGEYILDQHWGHDDAVVAFPGFELKVLPTSGFLAEGLFWMTNAEIHRRLAGGDLDGSPDDYRRRSAWHRAAAEGDDAALKRLASQDGYTGTPDHRGLTALHLAAGEGHEAAARVLLQAGADPAAADMYGRAALHLAAGRGHDMVAALLLEAGAPPSAADRGGEAPLHRAARGGHEKTAALLLEAGGHQPAAVCREGRTALHLAAGEGHDAVAALLLEAGAPLLKADGNDMTPLHFAAMGSREAMTRFLLEAGAAIEARDRWGRTPLHWAANLQRREAGANTGAVETLLEAGAAVDAADRYGRTPLFDAANSGAAEAVRLLLEHGADPGRRAGDGRPARDGSPEFVRRLLDGL